jgi:hypothetical protein
MSEWLTTRQMMDKLKVGEVAKSKHFDLYVTKDSGGGFYFTDKTGESFVEEYGHNGWCVLTSTFLSDEWRILPRYVSFEEAMKALKEGKRVALYINNYKETFHLDEELDSLTLRDLIEGKWTIEE